MGYEPARCGSTRIDLVNYIAYMDGHHHYLFDEENLRAVLMNRGYRDVRLRAFDEALDLPAHRDYSLYVEAFK